METRHAYNPRLLVRSIVLALTGIIISLIMLFVFRPNLPMTLIWILIICTCLLGGFIAWSRQRVIVIMTEDSISLKGLKSQSLDWTKVTGLKLAFYAKRRDQRDGWMRLTIRSGIVQIKIDSQISNFRIILDQAAATIRRNGYEIDYFTRVNLHAAGIDYEKLR
ncbi:MAG: hypothetical protein ORO03_08055 [Alphaproteobacteria bacterium]|nr:hypothetical protein [Alphaproteobacteria bacterium]